MGLLPSGTASSSRNLCSPSLPHTPVRQFELHSSCSPFPLLGLPVWHQSSSTPSSGAPLRRIQDLLGNVSQGREGRALGKLLDEVSAFFQALAELGVQGDAACGTGERRVRARSLYGQGSKTHCQGQLQGKG